MAKFRSKPVEVEAEQWFPGKAVAGVEEKKTEIHYSDDRKLFYVTRPGCSPRSWMSVEKTPGAVPAEQQDGGGIFSPQLGQITTIEQETYHRKVFPFSFFSVSTKQKIVEPLDENSELFKDFAALSDWPEEVKPYAHVVTAHGDRLKVEAGDWVIREPNQSKPDVVLAYPCKPDVFAAKYEAVE